MEEEEDAFQVLCDVLTPETPPQVQEEESECKPSRPQRERKHPVLYQSDEVALLDKKGVKE